MFRIFTSLIIVIICSIYCYNCIKIIPDRTEITYVSEKYFCNSSASVRRSSKRGEYVFNLQTYIKKELGNNVSMHITIYEYRSKYNQYIPTFIEFHFKLCDLILHDKIFGAVLRMSGVTQCPVSAGFLGMYNMTFNADIPFKINFEKGKLFIKLTKEPENELMSSLEIVISIPKK